VTSATCASRPGIAASRSDARKLRALLADLQDLTMQIIDEGNGRSRDLANRRGILRKVWSEPA
jgi:hypothetical protein